MKRRKNKGQIRNELQKWINKLLMLIVFPILFCLNGMTANAEVIVTEMPSYRFYGDLTRSEQKKLEESGMPDVEGRTCSGLVYYMLHPEMRNVGTANESGRYFRQATLTRWYYDAIRDNESYYPRRPQNGWYCTGVGEDEDGEYAYAGYYGTSSVLIVPSKLYVDGYGWLNVRGLNVENHYMVYVSLGKQVKYIVRCCGSRLATIKGGKNVETIGYKAFQDCVSLKKLPLFPNLQTIDNFAFYGCFRLKDIPLGDNVSGISMNAFGWYDVILGNYDYDNRLEDDYSYEDGLRDDDRIYGITLYANEGSLTYWTLENLYEFHYVPYNNYNDEKNTYVYSENYVEQYADHISFEYLHNYVEQEDEYDIVWVNLPTRDTSIDLIPPTLPDIDADDDDVDEEEEETEEEEEKEFVDYLIELLNKGTITYSMLFALIMSVFSFTPMPLWIQKQFSGDMIDVLQGQLLRYKDMDPVTRTEMAKVYLEDLAIVADKVPNSKALGLLIRSGKAVNKMLELLASGESLENAFDKAVMSYGASELVGLASNANPTFATWDTVVTILFGGSEAKDATNIGDNVEHLADLIYDVVKLDPGDHGASDLIMDRLNSGVYGTNLKNYAGVIDITMNGDWCYVAQGIRDMGPLQFLDNICKSAESVTTDKSPVTSAMLDLFNKYVREYYAGTLFKG